MPWGLARDGVRVESEFLTGVMHRHRPARIRGAPKQKRRPWEAAFLNESLRPAFDQVPGMFSNPILVMPARRAVASTSARI